MAGLREEIERLHRGERVAGGEEGLEVAHLRGRVARDVDDGVRGEGKELGEEGLVAALARRVDDHGGLGGGKRQPGEDRRGVTRAELGVGDAVGRGIFPREADAALADLDAGHALECRRGRQREEPAATVGVDEETGRAGRGLFPHIAGEGREDEGVVLEKIAGEKTEPERR